MPNVDGTRNEIKIDKEKSERIVAQILRDETKMLSSDANALATIIAQTKSGRASSGALFIRSVATFPMTLSYKQL